MDIKEITNCLLTKDVNKYTEKKNGLTYLSWANAVGEVLKEYPTMRYSVKKDSNGFPCFGNNENGYFVFTTVEIEGIEREMMLPVMDFRNKSMMTPTTFDINKAIMRCLTKNFAMFGLGLYIYAGEDLPEEGQEEVKTKVVLSRKEMIEKFDSLPADKYRQYMDEYKKRENKTADVKTTFLKNDFLIKISNIENWGDK